MHSVRFNRQESPSYINDGAGWTEAAAYEFCLRHGIKTGRVFVEPDRIAVRAHDAPEFAKDLRPGPAHQPRGVTVLICAKP